MLHLVPCYAGSSTALTCVSGPLQGVARQLAGALSVRLGALAGQAQAQLDGFKSRALRSDAPTPRQLCLHGVPMQRWHYHIEWSRVAEIVAQKPGRFKVLVVGSITPVLTSHIDMLMQQSANGVIPADTLSLIHI